MTSDKCIQCHERDALPEQTRCYECGGYVTVVDEVAKIGPARMAALDRLMARLEASEKPRQAKTRIVDDLMAQPFIARLEANEGKAATLDDVLRDMASEEVMSRYPKYPVLSVEEIAVAKPDEAYEACREGHIDVTGAIRGLADIHAKPEPSWAARKAAQVMEGCENQTVVISREALEMLLRETIAECARVMRERDDRSESGVNELTEAIRKLGE